MFYRMLKIITVFFLLCNSINAKNLHVMIINAKSGINTLQQDNNDVVKKIETFIKAKYHVKAQNINTFFSKNAATYKVSQADKDEIIKKFKHLESQLKKQDILWLFLLGYASHNSRGYSLTTTKGRLRGNDISKFLKNVKSEKVLFCFTPAGGDLIHDIKSIDNLTAFSATDSAGQNNPPQLPNFFADNCQNNPTKDIVEIITQSVAEVEQFYKSKSLLKAETAIALIDGKVTTLPLLKNSNALVKVKSLFEKNNIDEQSLFDIKKIKKTKPNYFKINKANNRTKQLLSSAKRKISLYSDYNAFYLKKNTEVIFNRDKSLRYNINEIIYLANDIGAEDFIYYVVPRDANVDKLRIIFPDGSYNESKLFNANQQKIEKLLSPRKGCIIEAKYSYDEPAGDQIFENFGSIPIQNSYPIDSSEIVLKKPQKSKLNVKLFNYNINKVKEIVNDNKHIFEFNNVPAFELLPNAPCRERIQPAIKFSSIDNWLKLAELIERLGKSAKSVDKKMIEFVKKITKDATNDTEKIQKLYNFLCNLRYETTPYGISGLKPRKVNTIIKERFGDCKDKANALVVMAGVLGIKGYVALVNRGKYTDINFPSWQFNHAIAYFPKQKIWCDATDGSTPFGVLPRGDIGRNALLLDGQKSRFKKVHLYSKDSNIMKQKIVFTKKKDGCWVGVIKLYLEGLPDYNLRGSLKRLNPKQKTYVFAQLLNTINPVIELKDFKIISNLNNLNEPLQIELNTTPFDINPTKLTFNLGFGIHDKFISQQRKYGIVINDGQPLLINQTIDIHGEKGPVCNIKSTDKSLLEWSYKSENSTDSNMWHRKVELNIKNGFISKTEYPKIKKSIRQFYKVILGYIKGTSKNSF